MLFESLKVSFIIESFDFYGLFSLENTTRLFLVLFGSLKVSFLIESFDFYGL